MVPSERDHNRYVDDLHDRAQFLRPDWTPGKLPPEESNAVDVGENYGAEFTKVKLLDIP